jgi:hypothetical protein
MKSSNIVSKFILLFLAVCTISTTYAQGVTVNARVYLQGALTNSFETGTTHDRPLMRDDLRDNPFTNTRSIPDEDIYQTPLVINDYITIDVTGSYTHVACGAYHQYQKVPAPSAVFNVTGEDAIVDWVFLELRNKNNNANVVATRSGLVQRDGDVVDLDGTSAVFFPDVAVDNYYLAIRHRNHLGAMTKFAQTPEQLAGLVDFSDFTTDVFDFGITADQFNYSGLALSTMNVEGYELRALWAGDCNADGKIGYRGKQNDLTVLQEEIAGFDMELNPLFKLDFQLSVGYLQGDIDMNGKTKFDNPDDDKNILLVQVVLYSLNTKNITNFAHLLEQLP